MVVIPNMYFLPGTELVPIPPTVDFSEAASLPMNYATAYQMFNRCADLNLGKRMLVHGAGSGVGTALLQLGALSKVEMIGTASKKNMRY